MKNNYQKYFVIGFNKTATNTFHNLFENNELKSYHCGISWKTENWKDKLNDFDCFSDINWCLEDVKYLNNLYPNAIFILNCRDLNKWLISRFKHGLREFMNKGKHAFYPYTYDKCKSWIYHREKYHSDILNYFSDIPNKLIIVNIDKNNWIDFVCSQLQFKNNKISSSNIHPTNKQNNHHKNIIELVNVTLQKLQYDKDSVLIKDKDLLNKQIQIYNHYI